MTGLVPDWGQVFHMAGRQTSVVGAWGRAGIPVLDMARHSHQAQPRRCGANGLRRLPGRAKGLVGIAPARIFDSWVAIVFNAFYLERLHTEIVHRQAGRRLCGDCIFVRRRDIGRIAGQHRDVDVLEDLAWGDAEDAVAGFDQIVPFATAMLAAEVVGEAEAGAELFGFD